MPLQYPVLLYLLGAGAVDRVPRPRRGAAAGLAGCLDAGRGAVPDGLPGRPQPRRLRRDRRRLRQRRRRRPHRPRRTDLRQLPRRRLPGRHLRPGQLLRLRPLRADLALVGQLGRPAGRPRRRGHLRHRSPSASCSCSASASAPDRRAAASPRSSPSAGPPTPTPPSPWSRTPTTPWWRCCWSRRSWSSPDQWPAAPSHPSPPSRSSPRRCSRPMLLTYRPNPKAAPECGPGGCPRTEAQPPPAGRPPRPRSAPLRRGLPPGRSPRHALAGDRPRPPHVYDRTIAYQSGRDSPFSIWGQVPSLEPLRIAILVGDRRACPSLLAFRPRRKSLVQVAALGAALLISLQLTLQHWFYLYIVWFYPLLLVAMAAPAEPSRSRVTRRQEPEPSPARTSPPAPAR